MHWVVRTDAHNVTLGSPAIRSNDANTAEVGAPMLGIFDHLMVLAYLMRAEATK